VAGCIVFAHANGFPGGTYREIFLRWRAQGWRVHAPDKLGHDPDYPVTSNWPHLRDQLIAFAEAKASQGAYFVGHSLGGYLALMAACRRPDLARGVVMIDAPLVTGWRAHSLQVAKATGLIKRFSPGRISRRRRHEWPSRRALREHFAAKSAFARWEPKVLTDYLRHGFVEEDGVFRLAFRREIETHIYDTLPHQLDTMLRRHPPRCPVALLAGTQSAEIHQAGLAASRAVVHERLRWIEGTHLFPMEKPAETAEAVLELIGAMPNAR
jgi:pimeloyl-ACP methyl ester carboxylesterase